MNDDARPPQPSSQSGSTRARRAWLLVAAVAILLNAALIGLVVSRSDPFSSRSASSAPGTVPAPAQKQTVRIVELAPINGDFDSLDPAQISYDASYNVGQLVFPALITLDDGG
jgi:hypothetical protein